MRSNEDCIPIIWLCITKYCPSRRVKRSTLAVGNGWTAFFSGFSNMQGVLFCLHRRQGGSPSHLFLPFLHAVQARAPRFGMCVDDGCGETGESPCCGDPSTGIGFWETSCGWVIPFALGMLLVRRRFEGTSGWLEVMVVKDEDIASKCWGMISLRVYHQAFWPRRLPALSLKHTSTPCYQVLSATCEERCFHGNCS